MKKGQGSTEYLVLLAMVLVVAMAAIALLRLFSELAGNLYEEIGYPFNQTKSISLTIKTSNLSAENDGIFTYSDYGDMINCNGTYGNSTVRCKLVMDIICETDGQGNITCNEIRPAGEYVIQQSKLGWIVANALEQKYTLEVAACLDNVPAFSFLPIAGDEYNRIEQCWQNIGGVE